MRTIGKICSVLLLSALVRCPAVAQQMGVQLASRSLNCTDGNMLIKTLHRNRVLRQKGNSFISAGLLYDRATALISAGTPAIEKQYRVGVPLVTGYHLGRWTLEAGAFLGVNACRPQRSPWFAQPASDGLQSITLSSATSFLVGLGVDCSAAGQISLRYLRLDDLPENNVLGKVQLGWTWKW
ncbi:MAG: hypothetical protein DA408_03050 [Bacteroidetes bacterium]|nr:MAG: hypothetical protein C7N36_03145 [Bacteroidota bacterium]PTM14577.1 MAG: hypothetical protein DA408_03050 [Bacteroidota bacterium]